MTSFTTAEILGVGVAPTPTYGRGLYEPLDLVDPAAVATPDWHFPADSGASPCAEASIVELEDRNFDTWRINLGALYN